MEEEIENRPLVLYVDDERNNLLSFKATFRLEFDVKLASSPDEALEILKICEPHVIISDFRMPFMTGVEMFQKIRINYPEPLRVLLTAFGDTQSLSDAINRGQIYRYLKKPWNEDEIRDVVWDGFEFYMTRNALRDRNKELIEAYKDLDRFVYSVSHDLRSPMMGILAISNLLKRCTNINDVYDYADLIAKNVNRLDEFVFNLLEYYKVKRGELTIQDVDFSDLIQKMVEIYSSEAQSKGIKIIVNVEQNEAFRSDPLIIMVALQNLLSNAIKYQKEDYNDKQVRFDVIVRSGVANIKVEDNGIGIMEEFVHRIFEMFFRASSVGQGSGIGLYNTKHALDKLGAEIKVNSVLDQGTTFEITMPSK